MRAPPTRHSRSRRSASIANARNTPVMGASQCGKSQTSVSSTRPRIAPVATSGRSRQSSADRGNASSGRKRAGPKKNASTRLSLSSNACRNPQNVLT